MSTSTTHHATLKVPLCQVSTSHMDPTVQRHRVVAIVVHMHTWYEDPRTARR